MKKALLTLAAAAALANAAPASAAIVVSLNPAAQSVAVGDTIVVNVNISGLGSEILSVFDLNVLFDSTLANSGVTGFFGAQFGLTSTDSIFDADFATGNTGARGGSLLDDADLAALQTDDGFTFLTFEWTATADGALFLNFGADAGTERNVVGRDALSLNAAFQGACVSIGTGSCNAVPEPSTYALAGLALLGCGLASTARRRRRALPVTPV